VFVGLCVVQDGLLVGGWFFVGGGVFAEWVMLVPDCIVLFVVVFCFRCCSIAGSTCVSGFK
jgi:hypothetical protein